MKSMPKNNNSKNNPKVSLGKKTDAGYKYSSRINFSEDLSTQITKLMQEKKAKDNLELRIDQLKGIAKRYANKEKNLDYYFEIGKFLSFLDDKIFQNIRPYSVYRRIAEEISEILPHIQEADVTSKHLDVMYKMGKIGKKDIHKAVWDQWYEILKFKDLSGDKKLLSKVISECRTGASGPTLREKIKKLIKK